MISGSGNGSFTANLIGLTIGKTYYVKAYATNSAGTAYGNEVSFTTSIAILPTLTTNNASSITSTTALSGGNITNNGGDSITARGVCWSLSPNPTITLSTKSYDSTGLNYFSSSITSLSLDHIYYVRAFATNSAGTAYGNQIFFMPQLAIGDSYKGGKIVYFFQPGLTSPYTEPDDPGYVAGQVNGLIAAPYDQSTGAEWGCEGTINSSGSCTGWGVDRCSLGAGSSNTSLIMDGCSTSGIAARICGDLVLNGYSDWYLPSIHELIHLSAIGSFDAGISYWSSSEPIMNFLLPYSDPAITALSLNADGYKYAVNKSNMLHVRAFRNFTGDYSMPVLTTTAISSLTDSSAISGGNITSNGGASSVIRGVCWDINPSPTIAGTGYHTFDGTGTGSFTSLINSGLIGGTTYYVRAYATNCAGTAYGNEVSFTTNMFLSTVSTITPSQITSTSATSGFNLIRDGGGVYYIGICWSTLPNPTISNFTSTGALSGLTGNTLYYIRAYVTSSLGTTYGNEVSFTTLPPTLGTIFTTSASNIFSTTALCDVTLTDNGGSSIIAIGVCYSLSPNPTIANNTVAGVYVNFGMYDCSLSNLTPNTLYYYRAFATNGVGTAYGAERSFSTTPSLYTAGGGVTDYDGNVYESVIILNSQEWMKQNLKVTHYRNGNPIQNVTDGATWMALTTGGYCDYNNTSSNSATYGRLYNYYTVVDARNLCPTGWHVPSNDEWQNLAESYLGDERYSGGKLKDTGTTYWVNCSQNIASNESGFTALPGGQRSWNGSFAYKGTRGYWWSSTENNSTKAKSRSLYCSIDAVHTNDTKTYGYSMRCIKDVATQPAPPTVTSIATSLITATSATSGGNVTNSGGDVVTSRGVCWNTFPNSSIANNKTSDGTGTGVFTSSLTGLTPGTTYYIRAYATNYGGTSYGTETSFTTLALTTATLSTVSASLIAGTTAICGGNITYDGGSTVTARGVCWSTSANPTIALSTKTSDGTGIGTFSSSIAGLTANTTYYVRAYATNSIGTNYGSQISFNSGYAFGASYGGGLVFYNDGSGHGFISATGNQSSGAVWGCSGTTIPGDSTGIGKGLANTNAIVAACSTTGIAARICYDLVLNTYSDWYLPSIDELTLMYNNLKLNGFGSFTSASYWSSSQNTSTTAYYKSFSSGTQSTSAKTTLYYVRAIRNF